MRFSTKALWAASITAGIVLTTTIPAVATESHYQGYQCLTGWTYSAGDSTSSSKHKHQDSGAGAYKQKSFTSGNHTFKGYYKSPYFIDETVSTTGTFASYILGCYG